MSNKIISIFKISWYLSEYVLRCIYNNFIAIEPSFKLSFSNLFWFNLMSKKRIGGAHKDCNEMDSLQKPVLHR